jgi:hypothetical protein
MSGGLTHKGDQLLMLLELIEEVKEVRMRAHLKSPN